MGRSHAQGQEGSDSSQLSKIPRTLYVAEVGRVERDLHGC